MCTYCEDRCCLNMFVHLAFFCLLIEMSVLSSTFVWCLPPESYVSFTHAHIDIHIFIYL